MPGKGESEEGPQAQAVQGRLKAWLRPHLPALLLALGLMLVGLAALALHGSAAAMIAAFAAFGASSAGYSMSTQTMVLEFGAREDVPMRIALSTMVEGGLSGTAPILGGLLLGWAGAGAMLGCAALLTAVALWLMLFRVTDPRKAVARVYSD